MLLTVREFVLYHYGISSGIPYKPEEKLSLFELAKYEPRGRLISEVLLHFPVTRQGAGVGMFLVQL